MKEKKIILLSLAIPVLFVVTALFKDTLEYFFRGSEKYHYIYSIGATISFFIQILLVLASFSIGMYIVVNRKQYSLWTNIITLLFGLSVFLYLTIGIAYLIISEIVKSV